MSLLVVQSSIFFTMQIHYPLFNFYAGEDANLPELADFIVTSQTVGSSRVNDMQNDEVSLSLLKTFFSTDPFVIFDSGLFYHLPSPSFSRFASYMYISKMPTFSIIFLWVKYSYIPEHWRSVSRNVAFIASSTFVVP